MPSSNNEHRIESKNIPPPAHKQCIISAVGKESLHPIWISGKQNFDLHLIVYDDSFEKFKSDTPFIEQSSGYKLSLVYQYLQKYPQFINHYEYFYLPDDDIKIQPNGIKRLFRYMKKYDFAIAQPAISNEHFTYPHTKRKFFSRFRYTNFVEMMQPCFSREALKKTLFTFNKNSSGWGANFHWGELVDYKKRNMAIIDRVPSIHTRPVQSSHHDELEEYLREYNLERKIYDNI